MDGEEQVTAEHIANLFQSVMFTGFLYLFFDKPKGLLIKILPFLGTALLLLGNLTYYTYAGDNALGKGLYLDSLICLIILEIYSLVFLRGKDYQRVIMPIVAFTLNAVVSYSFSYFVSLVTGIPFEESLVVSSTFRYLCLVAVNTTTAVLLWLIIRLGSERIRLVGAYEATAFSIIPALGTIILYCLFFIFNATDYDEDVLVYIYIITLAVLAIAALAWILILHVSKANAAKTELLLTTQREKLYKESILDSNEQIEKISSAKHEMSNRMHALEILISEGNYEQALAICHDTMSYLKMTRTPVHTSNPVLNAIINVAQEKAARHNIDFVIEVTDLLSELSSSDTISLIGNLCDNAVEYLCDKPEDVRRMKLSIRSHLDYYLISCSNSIVTSVIGSNPHFLTSKSDRASHGKGIKILRRIAAEHEGDVKVEEDEKTITITVVLKKK